MSNYITNDQWSKWRTKLTRAVNSGNPDKVFDVVDAWHLFIQEGDCAYPDDWARFDRAEMDARWVKERARKDPIWG